jgi:DNA mismatch repair protein MutL
MPEIKVNPEFNPFHNTPNREDKNVSAIQSHGFAKMTPKKEDWENFYDISKTQTSSVDNDDDDQGEVEQITINSSINEEYSEEKKKPVQINDKYILTSVKNGFMLIDQYRAHCRILFDELMSKITATSAKSQQLLFPEELEIDQSEKVFWQDLLPTLQAVGFDLLIDGKVIQISAVPVVLKDKNPQRVLIDLMEEFRHSEQTDLDLETKIVSGIASAMAIRGGTKLNSEEMTFIIDALFASSIAAHVSPRGKKIIETFSMDELTKRFN